MTIFKIIFCKILSKTHQIAPFLKILLGGACPRTPLANAWRAMQITLLFQKNFEPPPK